MTHQRIFPTSDDHPAGLATEGPLSEKDEQGQVIERQRKLGEQALEKWRRLKQAMSPTGEIKKGLPQADR